MAESVILIFDKEGIDGSCRRIGVRQLNVLKLVRCLVDFRPGRSLLWAKWVVPWRPPEDAVWSFYNFLRANDFRVEIVEPKPISRAENRHEPNSCDFAVIDAIYLAARKADTILLAGNDGHYCRALQAAQSHAGCRIELLADRGGLSSLLVADRIHFLDDLVRDFDLDRAASRLAERNGFDK